MRNFLKRGRTFLLLPVVLFAASSCNDTSFNPAQNSDPTNTVGEKEILINLSIPVQNSPQTQFRSIGNEDENAIPTVNILAFRVDDFGNEYFDYPCAFRSVDNQKGWATVKMKPYRQRFVVIANADKEISNLLKLKEPWQGISKNELLSSLEFALNADNSDNNGGWKTINSANYTAFPMWGEIKTPLLVNSVTDSFGETIQLLRMVARIDVMNSAQAKFKLTSVHLYNTYTKGRIVPDAANIALNNGKMGAIKVTLPNDFYTGGALDLNKIYATPYTNKSIRYTDVNADGNMRNVIYTFERDSTGIYSGGGADPLNTICLVIGGTLGNNPTPYYYRVDFIQDKKHMDILRNHRYIANITNVKDAGYEDPDTAFESKAFNMDAEILEWTDDDFDVVFDDVHYLAVSRNNVFFSKKAYDRNDPKSLLTVKTDCSSWYVESIFDKGTTKTATWLTVTPPSSKSNPIQSDIVLGNNVYFNVMPNLTGKDRTAEVTIVAGRLRYVESVTQTTVDPVSITFYKLDIEDFNYIHDMIETGTLPGRLTSDTLRIEQCGFVRHSKHLVAAWTPRNSDLVIYKAPCINVPGYIYDHEDQIQFKPALAFISEGRGDFFEYHRPYEESFRGIEEWEITPPFYYVGGESQERYAIDVIFNLSNELGETLSKRLTIMYDFYQKCD